MKKLAAGFTRFRQQMSQANWGLIEYFFLLLLVSFFLYGVISLGWTFWRIWLPVGFFSVVAAVVIVKLGGEPIEFLLGLALIGVGLEKKTRREYALEYSLKSCLMNVGFGPTGTDGHANVVESSRYVIRVEKEDVTDIVVAKGRIEHHEYSTDFRESHIVSRFSNLEAFLRHCIKKRIAWACIAAMASSPTVMNAMKEARVSDYLAATKDLEKEMHGAFNSRLKTFLNGRVFRIARSIIDR